MIPKIIQAESVARDLAATGEEWINNGVRMWKMYGGSWLGFDYKTSRYVFIK